MKMAMYDVLSGERLEDLEVQPFLAAKVEPGEPIVFDRLIVVPMPEPADA